MSYGNPLPHFYSLPSDPSLSYPPPHFQSLSSDPSLSQLPPPVVNPFPASGIYPSNFTAIAAQPINYADPNAVSSSWVVKQAEPIKYSPALQPLSKEAIASKSYSTPQNYTLLGPQMVSKVHKKKVKHLKSFPKKLSVSQSVWCELCKVECTNVHIYEKHLNGKKHGKGLLKLCAPALQSASMATTGGQGTPGVPSKPDNIEVKKQKLLEGGAAIQSMRICAICNVACNGEVAFSDHVAGKKHVAKERALSTVGNSDSVSGKTQESNAESSQTKKRKNVESALAWCDVCKISCTSNDGLKIHMVGKKHQKNLQKFQGPNSNSLITPGPNSNTVTPLPPTNPSLPEQQQAKKKGQSKDVEAKRRIIMECGAAADALRTCTICNVVCNSETVFNSHLAGQKHAAMVKQAVAATATASSGLQVVYPAA